MRCYFHAAGGTVYSREGLGSLPYPINWERLVTRCGGTDPKWEPWNGWANQPDVLTFEHPTGNVPGNDEELSAKLWDFSLIVYPVDWH